MPEFLKLKPPFEALSLLLTAIPEREVPSEVIATDSALNRVLIKDVLAPHPLPEFHRSTVDGYAVRASDTYGASESLPAFARYLAELPMGKEPDITIEPGTAALIHTGGMIPHGSDAVVMLEQAQLVSKDSLEIYRPVGVNENVIQTGEDVSAGDKVISAGTRLRIPEIGGLMSFGITEVPVAKKPRVAILSSGDEIVSPDLKPAYGQVRDINSTTMSLIVQEAGGEPIPYGIVADSESDLLEVTRKAFAECDAILFTAGSSASSRDLTSRVIEKLGQPGVLVHGVQVRPGKPTILAVCDGKPVIGLPGNPVSALVIAGIFVKPVVKRLLGEIEKNISPTIKAHLLGNIPSLAGRDDWVPVSLFKDMGIWKAEPIHFKSNLIFNLVKADGLVHIPADVTGLSAGSLIEVELI